MKNKGITLIALIITIVIMMILVGVTVAISLNSNLFKTSQEVAFKNAISKLDEQLYGLREIGKYTGETRDYSNMIPGELKGYIGITDTGYLIYIGDKNAEQKKWAEELGVAILDDKLAENVIITEEGRVFIDTRIEQSDEIGELAGELGIANAPEEYIFKTKLEELVNLAKKYVEEGNSTAAHNILALQYIRRSRYSGGLWDLLIEEVDTEFVQYVEDNKSALLDINDLTDPVTGENIDFVHSMASLNVYLENVDNTDTLKEFACWAGDLCTFTKEIYQWYASGTYTDEELKEYTKSKLGGNSTFGFADILADMDAVNISELAKSGGDLDDIIYSYYYGENTSKCQNRYSEFVSYVSQYNFVNDAEDAAWQFLGKGRLGTFVWAMNLIGKDIYDEIDYIVFRTVAKCFGEFINERI